MAIGNYAGGINTIIPLFEESGRLKIEYSRNPKTFAVNKYTAQIQAPLTRGAYLEFNPLDAYRYNPNAAKWAYGAPRPANSLNLQFIQKNFVTDPYSFSGELEQKSVDLASWDLKSDNLDFLARQAMLNRTYQTLQVVTNTSNYTSTVNYFATATAVTGDAPPGGDISLGTTADPRIMKLFNTAAEAIFTATGGFGQGDIGVLMSRKTAYKLAPSRELREYVMQQLGAEKMIDGTKSSMNDVAGIPGNLYGFNVVIEDTYSTRNAPEASGDALTSELGVGAMVFFLRDSGLSKNYLSKNFSTFTTFVNEDMVAEAAPDQWNRLLKFSVTDNFIVKMTAPQTAYYVANVFA